MASSSISSVSHCCLCRCFEVSPSSAGKRKHVVRKVPIAQHTDLKTMTQIHTCKKNTNTVTQFQTPIGTLNGCCYIINLRKPNG